MSECNKHIVVLSALLWTTLFVTVSFLGIVVKNLRASAGDARDVGSILRQEDPME